MTRRVMVVTGSRAEFGLLDPVMRAIDAHPSLDLSVVVAGAHLLPPAETWREVADRWPIAATVPLQAADARTRLADAIALGRGVSGVALALRDPAPDWVVVLGDRIEAFAAAAAASVGGVAVAHLHGGDRAEGVADEAMRHAISKLAHLHLPATPASAERLVRMGESPERIHIVGSPALDDLPACEPLADERWDELGAPEAALLLHPIGRGDDAEADDARAILAGLCGLRLLGLAPNADPGRGGIARTLAESRAQGRLAAYIEHLPRAEFVGLLKRIAASGGVLVGNSSAGLIEAAAVRVPAVDIGPRQAGRERPGNVVHVEDPTPENIAAAVAAARGRDLSDLDHPYGDGRTGHRVAEALARVDPASAAVLRKRNAY